MKFLHEVGSYGLAGGFAVQLIVLSGPEDEAARTLVQSITLWLVMPSFLVVCASGVVAMVVRPTFFSKGWVWMKIILTVPTAYPPVATFPGFFEYPETPLQSPLWLCLVVSILITALSVWRPKGATVRR
jgi:hypothetical protein